jgi:exonuclease III
MIFMVNQSNTIYSRTTINNIINIFHQNIRDLRFKCNELLCHLQNELTHILCFTEHHLDKDKLAILNIDNYQIGAHYSRNNYDEGGACIFVHNSLKFSAINLDSYCIDKDTEACAIRLNSIWKRVCMLTVYKSRNGNFTNFLTKMELILQNICKRKAKVIVCGDFNVNYMVNSCRKRQLDALLLSFNLCSIVKFPTRIGFNTSTIIDNIFLDSYQYDRYEIFPVTNGLSDHKAQFLTLHLTPTTNKDNRTNFIRNINNSTVYDFQMKLSYETGNLYLIVMI